MPSFRIQKSMRFPPFKLLHVFTEDPSFKYNISASDMLPASLNDVNLIIDDSNLAETHPHGNPELRELLAEQHDMNMENILVTAGCSEANFDVCAALLRPGDEAVVVIPNYPPLRDLPKGLGAKIKQVKLRYEDDFQINLDTLEEAITKKTRLVILTNINNPTSAIIDKRQISEIGDLADKRKFYVLWDETFRELAFEKCPPTAAVFGERMVVTNTMSKVYGMDGLRLGWIVASGAILSRITNVTDYVTVTPPALSEKITLAVLKEKGKFLKRTKDILSRNKVIVNYWLKRNDKVHWKDPGIGNIAFPKVDTDVDHLADMLLERYSTVIASGTLFGMKGYFRLGFGRDAIELRKGLENFDEALQLLE